MAAASVGSSKTGSRASSKAGSKTSKGSKGSSKSGKISNPFDERSYQGEARELMHQAVQQFFIEEPAPAATPTGTQLEELLQVKDAPEVKVDDKVTHKVLDSSKVKAVKYEKLKGPHTPKPHPKVLKSIIRPTTPTTPISDLSNPSFECRDAKANRTKSDPRREAREDLEREFFDTVTSLHDEETISDLSDELIARERKYPPIQARDLSKFEAPKDKWKNFKDKHCAQSCVPIDENNKGKPMISKKDDTLDFIFELVEFAFCTPMNEPSRCCKISNVSKSAKSSKRNLRANLPTYTPGGGLPKSNSLVSSDDSQPCRSSQPKSRKSKNKGGLKAKPAPLMHAKESSKPSADYLQEAPELPHDDSDSFSYVLDTKEVISRAKQALSDVKKLSKKEVPSREEALLKVKKPSIAVEMMNSTRTSRTARTAESTQESKESGVSNMRELACVFSASSVSSYCTRDEVGHRNSERKRVRFAPTWKTTISSVIDLFTSKLQSIDSAVGVSKLIYVFAMAIVFAFWPAMAEKDRRKVQKKKPKRQASLLKLVTNG